MRIAVIKLLEKSEDFRCAKNINAGIDFVDLAFCAGRILFFDNPLNPVLATNNPAISGRFSHLCRQNRNSRTAVAMVL